MLIANFTPDRITTMYIGRTRTFKPGDMDDVPDKEGNHVLTKWAKRGLIRINFDEYKDEARLERKRQQAMTIYEDFWTKQISDFNQLNEAMKNENKAYIRPGMELRSKAKELGIELIGPWKVAQPTDDGKIRALKEENAELKEQVKIVTGQMAELMQMMKEMKSQVEVSKFDTAEIVGRFKNMTKAQFQPWVYDNLEEAEHWPDQVLEKIVDKWASFYPDEECPIVLTKKE